MNLKKEGVFMKKSYDSKSCNGALKKGGALQAVDPAFVVRLLRDSMLIAQFSDPALSLQPLKCYREFFPACPLFFHAHDFSFPMTLLI